MDDELIDLVARRFVYAEESDATGVYTRITTPMHDPEFVVLGRGLDRTTKRAIREYLERQAEKVRGIQWGAAR